MLVETVDLVCNWTVVKTAQIDGTVPDVEGSVAHPGVGLRETAGGPRLAANDEKAKGG